jgi:glutaredoxin 3
MNITIYTKTNCPNCVSAKALLKSKGLTYNEVNLDLDAERAAFMDVFKDARSMPQIFIDRQRVGGLTGLQAALKQVGI